MPNITTEQIIQELALQPLPIEGGYYSIEYRSDEEIPAAALPDRYHNNRVLGGTIYFLETEQQFSAMHKLPTDEVYYYHLGDPLEMLLLYPDGSGETVLLGPDITAGQRLQILAPHDCWQGSRPLPGGEHGFGLVSTSMAPGFDDSDPVFAKRETLQAEYPEFSTLIEALTRLESHNV